MLQPHLKSGTLVLIAGKIAGVIVSRIDAIYYSVLSQGQLYRVHRDDMIECED